MTGPAMTTPAARTVERARTIAGWLDDKGFPHEAQIVRDLCRSHDGSRLANARLWRDNAELREQLKGCRP